MSRIRADALMELATRVLCTANTAPENARIVAEALVGADMDGLASHGVSRLPAYADQARSGKVDGHAVPQVECLTASMVRVDAGTGFAFPALRAGLDTAIDLARETGIVAVAIANSHHFGVAGHHVERVANAGLVALGFGNSPAAIAPWGGANAVFGTNPIAFAAPRVEHAPIVVDASLSKVARGKVMVAKQCGESIPQGWAFDVNGEPTTDPTAALAGGTMVPLGDAKGAALALMVEILAAAVTGSNFGFEASSFFVAEGPAPRVGQFFLVIDPGYVAGDAFALRLETLVDAIVRQSGTRLPGERRLILRDEHGQDGLDIPAALLQELRSRAVSVQGVV